MKEFIFNLTDNELDKLQVFNGSEEEFLAIKDFYVKAWFEDGMLHRIGGPAYWNDGDEEWYQNNKLHRSDGPAIVCSDGSSSWHLEGLEFSKFFNQFFPMKNYIKNRFPGE